VPRDFTHPGGTFAPSPSTLPERPLTGLQVVQVLKRKRGLLNAWVDCNLWSAGSPFIAASPFGYRKIKATVSSQLTSLSSIELVIKV
jgi:hypothetical protein